MKHDLSIELQGENLNAKISGELTIYAVNDIQSKFKSHLTNPPALYLDLSAITALDTAGVQLLVFLNKAFHGSMHIIKHSPAVLKVFDLYGLIGYFGDPVALKNSDKKNYSFAYGLKKHPERLK